VSLHWKCTCGAGGDSSGLEPSPGEWTHANLDGHDIHHWMDTEPANGVVIPAGMSPGRFETEVSARAGLPHRIQGRGSSSLPDETHTPRDFEVARWIVREEIGYPQNPGVTPPTEEERASHTPSILAAFDTFDRTPTFVPTLSDDQLIDPPIDFSQARPHPRTKNDGKRKA